MLLNEKFLQIKIVITGVYNFRSYKCILFCTVLYFLMPIEQMKLGGRLSVETVYKDMPFLVNKLTL